MKPKLLSRLLAFFLPLSIGSPAAALAPSIETLSVNGVNLVLEKGTITVPENRAVPGSRALALPYQRLLARTPDPSRPPLFLLDGGPGASNLSFGIAPRELWGTRDLVAIGYRGVDGPTLLPDEAFTKALWNPDANHSEASLRATAQEFSAFVALCRSRGIDIDGYTMGEVVEDIDALRTALGYGKIDVYGVSYGTRLTYLYGRDHPETTGSLVMEGANPPGHFALLPADYDSVLGMYESLYGRSLADKVRTITQDMPAGWLWWPINRGLVKLGAPALLANPSTAPLFISAYEKAAAGDASGLAGLSLIAPLMTSGLHAGDLMFKGVADFVPGRDYLAETADQGQFGRAFLRGTFGMAQFLPRSDLPQYDPGEARAINAPTLVLNGTLDTQTPLRGVLADMMPLLKRGTLLTLKNYGHFNVVTDQGPAVARIMARFLETGEVDGSGLPEGVVSSRPSLDPSLVAWAATGVTVAGAAGLVGGILWLVLHP